MADIQYLSIHFLRLIRGWVAGAAAKAEKVRLPSPQLLCPALQWDSEKCSRQPESPLVSPACSGPSQGPPSRGTCVEGILTRCPNHLISLFSMWISSGSTPIRVRITADVPSIILSISCSRSSASLTSEQPRGS